MPRPLRVPAGSALGVGLLTTYLGLIVLLPLAAVVSRSLDGGLDAFWHAVSAPQAVAALKLTLIVSLIVAAINAVTGTLIAWVLVRDEFPGKRFVSALIDLPFALPTVVAGLTLLALYGPKGPVGIDVAFTRAKMVHGRAPSEAAASSMSRSSSSSTGCTARITNGSVTNSNASSTDSRVSATLIPTGLLGP